MAPDKKRAILLDRDGTLVEDSGFLNDPGRVRLLAGVSEALAALRKQGFLLVLVSNQSGIARGLITPREAEQVHRRIVALLEAEGVLLDGVHYCPHAPEEGCACRKPSPAMLLQAAQELNFDLSQSIMVGDKPRDVEAGWRAGCRTVLLTADPAAITCQPPPDCVARNWAEARAWIDDGLRAPALPAGP
jgi:D,D-heptose 1,7-bisphosphate phosphatase